MGGEEARERPGHIKAGPLSFGAGTRVRCLAPHRQARGVCGRALGVTEYSLSLKAIVWGEEQEMRYLNGGRSYLCRCGATSIFLVTESSG